MALHHVYLYGQSHSGTLESATESYGIVKQAISAVGNGGFIRKQYLPMTYQIVGKEDSE